MKVKALFAVMAFLMVVLFSYSTTSAQNEDKTKNVVSKAKPAPAAPAPKTVEPTTKHTVVVTDSLADSADKSKTAATGGEKPKSTSTSFGGNTVTVTDNMVGQSPEDGKWLTVTKWDGTKWATTRQWIPNKKQ